MKNKQKMTKLSPTLSIIALHENGLISTIKTPCLTEWIKTHDPNIHNLQETHFISKNTNRLKVKEYRNIFHANSNQKRGGLNYVNKTDFKK